jgi:hypothetical protein
MNCLRLCCFKEETSAACLMTIILTPLIFSLQSKLHACLPSASNKDICPKHTQSQVKVIDPPLTRASITAARDGPSNVYIFLSTSDVSTFSPNQSVNLAFAFAFTSSSIYIATCSKATPSAPRSSVNPTPTAMSGIKSVGRIK